METEAYEGWVTAFIENLREYFNLQGWRIKTEFYATDKDDSYAEATVNSTYYSATLKLYKQSKTDFEENTTETMGRLTMSIVHETIHLLLDPFHEKISPFLSESSTMDFMRVLEQQTQQLTMVFMKSIPEYLIPPR
jgi:hypothetical protein